MKILLWFMTFLTACMMLHAHETESYLFTLYFLWFVMFVLWTVVYYMYKKEEVK